MHDTKSLDSLFEIDIQDRPDMLVDRISEVCAVPQSAQNVMVLARDRETTIQILVDALAKDPALAAEMLRIANSPVYGQTNRVVSLHRAVVIIGMQELYNMAAAMAMLAAFPTEGELSEEIRLQAVVSATVARFIARELGGIDVSTAFICGLLCEIGALACLVVDKEKYSRLLIETSGSAERRAELEKERYGATSEQLGARMLSRNQLPKDVFSAVGVSIFTPPAEMSPLDKNTLFARLVAPGLMRSEKEADADLIAREIPALATQIDLVGTADARLVEICTEAGRAADLGIRGEATLIEDEEEESDMTTGEAGPADDPTVPPPVRGGPPASVRMDGRSSTVSNKKWIVLALVAAAVVAASVIISHYFL